METYLVGGAVRDQLLGLPVKERDWVVVGATPEEMERRGFRPVGRDFPVFLHPDTGEEYALARTERKTAPGYRGFTVHAAPDVSLEEDLMRRDLTVNAMALDEAGRLVDPWGGREDLEARRLRHVSPAFIEDPLRVLRVARFAARLGDLGFDVAPETVSLMREIGESGELDALVPERVWQETARALETDRPELYFETLRACGALERVFPELDRLWGVPQPPRWHPEVDTGVHTMLALARAAALTPSPRVRFAGLVHDLGKALTPPELLPAHHGHGDKGVAVIEDLARRLRIPNDHRDLGILASRYHGSIHRAGELRPGTVLKVLEGTDAFRRPERFEELLLACQADMQGREGFGQRPYPQADILRAAHAAAAAAGPGDTEGLAGEEIARNLRAARLEAIATRLARIRGASRGASPAPPR